MSLKVRRQRVPHLCSASPTPTRRVKAAFLALELAARRESTASGSRARANSSEGEVSCTRMEARHLGGRREVEG